MMSNPLGRVRVPRKVSSSATSGSCTPKPTVRTVTVLPITPSTRLLSRATALKYDEDDDDDDDDSIMPCTQVFNAKSEVFWNFEGSPRTRLTLDCDTGGSGDEEEFLARSKLTPKNSTPLVKLKTRPLRNPSLNDLYADKDFILMKELSEKVVAEEKDIASKENLKSPLLSNTQSPNANVSSDDPFSKDDSFLVMCSQAIETKAESSPDHQVNSKKTVKKSQYLSKRNLPAPPRFMLSPEKAFEDEGAEEFEMLLSQIDIPSETISKNPLKSDINSASKITGPPQSQISLKDEKSKSGISFKRFKSADDALQKETPSTEETRLTKSTEKNYNNSTNRSLLAGERKPCTRLDIEKKRQEAIQRRLINSQKSKKN